MSAGNATKTKADVKFKGVIRGIRYYNNNWGIIMVRPIEIKEGEIDKSLEKYDICVVGEMTEPLLDNTYMITANLVSDPKWGKQYKLESIVDVTSLDITDDRGKRAFLRTLFTRSQLEEMYKVLPDPYSTLANEDYKALVAVKGCGMKNAVIWCERFKKKMDIAKIYIELEDYSLSDLLIEKLLERYKSPDLIIEKVTKNPYILVNEIDGIGWATADKIAVKGGIDPLGTLRVTAYIKYYLRLCGESGKSWITPDELMGAILDNVGEEVQDETITTAIHGMSDVLYWNEDKTKIGLKYYYDLEHNIAEELIRLKKAKPICEYDGYESIIKEIEECNGWKYSDEQKDGIRKGLENNVCLIHGQAGCVDADTEYFNGYEWKRIADYEDGEMVAQYDMNTGLIVFNIPLKYHKIECDKLWHFVNMTNTVDQILSDEHRIIYKTSGIYAKEDVVKDVEYGEVTAGELVELLQRKQPIWKTLPISKPLKDFAEHWGCMVQKRLCYKDKVYAVPYGTIDGYKYCFTMPYGNIILRRVKKIFVTGNCGKTTIVSAILKVLSRYPSATCALSGRASARIAESTGQESYTIHRLLEYSNGDHDTKQGFKYHDENKLDQSIIIVDEISMIGASLFYCLLRAIPDGCKLIMLGDIGQLEAIGSGNVASDIIKSGVIEVVELKQIHRQALDSAIVTEARKARKGMQLITKNWVGKDIRGESQDLIIEAFSDKSNTFYKIMQAFSEGIEHYGIQDIQIIVPIKERGDACTYNLNNAAQELYNPYSEDKAEIKIVKRNRSYVIRAGDKVINTKNNYKLDPPIFNGNIGIVLNIDEEERSALIDFVGIGQVEVPRDSISSIELAYAVTGHKLQGSEVKYAIIGVDFSAYTLLSREWIYTAITRAKEKCLLLAQNSALRYAVNIEKVSTKQTYLCDQLQELSQKKIKF